MSALPKTSVVYFPPVADRKFLTSAVELLGQLQAESASRGHGMLASLIAIARGEAEDGLNTLATTEGSRGLAYDDADGVATLAQKFACRGDWEAEV